MYLINYACPRHHLVQLSGPYHNKGSWWSFDPNGQVLFLEKRIYVPKLINYACFSLIMHDPDTTSCSVSCPLSWLRFLPSFDPNRQVFFLETWILGPKLINYVCISLIMHAPDTISFSYLAPIITKVPDEVSTPTGKYYFWKRGFMSQNSLIMHVSH